LACLVRAQVKRDAPDLLHLGKKHVHGLRGRESDALENFLGAPLAPPVNAGAEQLGFAYGGHGLKCAHFEHKSTAHPRRTRSFSSSHSSSSRAFSDASCWRS